MGHAGRGLEALHQGPRERPPERHSRNEQGRQETISRQLVQGPGREAKLGEGAPRRTQAPSGPGQEIPGRLGEDRQVNPLTRSSFRKDLPSRDIPNEYLS